MAATSRRIFLRVRFIGVSLFLGVGGAGLGGCFYDYTGVKDEPPKLAPAPVLVDDEAREKKTEFDPYLVDRRPLGDWAVNASEAPVRLDVDTVVREKEAPLADLHPSYTQAATAARELVGDLTPGTAVLPSVNLIDGKAKQFDDGLYAALDQT